MSPLNKKLDTIEIGIISDTHGPLDQRAVKALQGVHSIIHAGDIVDESVMFFLRQIAPTTAVRGNMDSYTVSKDISKTAVVEFGETLIYVLHDLTRIDLDPKAAGFSAVIHGHTHRPEIHRKNGVLYLNPGSAGSPRYGFKPSIAKIKISAKRLTAKIIELD